MAMKFVQKATGAAPVTQAAPPVETPAKTTTTPAKAAEPAKKTGGVFKMFKGKEAQEQIANADKQAELKKQEQGKLWRYWMAPDSERQISFMDGDLDEDGLLNCDMFNEHTVKINGDFEQFICTAATTGGYCPICDRGDSPPALVGVFTVCDHTPHTVQKGNNAGKIIVNTRKLFVAKRETVKQLQKIAVKRGGLTGCTFDVTRGNDRTASVGTQFDFVSKMSLPEIMAKYGIVTKEDEQFGPADYAHELTYRTPEELIELGIGKQPTGPGYNKPKKDLSSQL